jgi:hypothetical protein
MSRIGVRLAPTSCLTAGHEAALHGPLLDEANVPHAFTKSLALGLIAPQAALEVALAATHFEATPFFLDSL